jgi:tether containing UBX domain for GLUT4
LKSSFITDIFRIQPVYAFVRSCLDPTASPKSFTLCKLCRSCQLQGLPRSKHRADSILGQPPKYSYPEHPPPPVPGQTSKKRPLSSAQIVVPANYGPVRGAPMAGLQGGKGGAESLGELGLVPQSVLMIRWDNDDMNGESTPISVWKWGAGLEMSEAGRRSCYRISDRLHANIIATGYPAPLLTELRQKAEPLPSASSHRAEQKQAETVTSASGSGDGEVKERKIPK